MHIKLAVYGTTKGRAPSNPLLALVVVEGDECGE